VGGSGIFQTPPIRRPPPSLNPHLQKMIRHCDPPDGGEAIRRILTTQNSPPS